MNEEMRSGITKKREVALYASTQHSQLSVFEVRRVDYDEHYEKLPPGQLREFAMRDYVRITEPIEVTFVPIGDEDITRNAVAMLDEEERKARLQLERDLARINDIRRKFLALAHDPVEDAA